METRRVGRWRARPVELTAGLSLLLGAFFLAAVAQPDQRGDGTYYAAARLLVHGRFGPEVYDNDWMMDQVEDLTEGRIRDVFRPNPPTASLLALPVAWLQPEAARQVWAGLNVLWLFASLALIGRTVFMSETRLLEAPRSLARRAGEIGFLHAAPWLAGLAFGLFAAPVVEGFQLGQAYILLLALFTLAWWGLRTHRAPLAGLSLALALALKTSGGPLWLLLAVRREWRALAWAGIGVAVLVGVTLPWVGLETWRAYLTDVLPAAAASPTVTATAFQSLLGLWAHLFRFDVVWNPAPLADWPALAGGLGPLSVAAVLGVALWRARRAPLDPAYGALAAASVFVVPFAEQHHYTLMALPMLIAVAAWNLRRSRWVGLALLVAALLMALPLGYEARALAAGWRALLTYPRLYGGLLLWGLLLHYAASPAAPEGQA